MFSQIILLLYALTNTIVVLGYGVNYVAAQGRAANQGVSATEDFCSTLWSRACQNGDCINGTKDDFECECWSGYVGKDCSTLTGPCVDEPCDHGGTCIPLRNGAFSCDCPREWMGVYCSDLKDPCLLSLCKQGSTCVKKADGEYECMCNVPWMGEHCEEENLCLIEVDECIDIPVPKCYPCRANESCQKTGPEKYSCVDVRQRNVSSRLVPPHADDDYPSENMFIPGVVIASLIIFLMFLLLCLFIDYLSKIRNRLILMADLQRLTLDTFYLLTIQTGRDPFAGTSVRIYCRIIGSLYQTKVLVLNNYLLDSMQQNDEVDFLISTPQPLGRILKVQIWLDPDEILERCCTVRPFWFCRNVMIRDIKTDQIWYFFVRKWFSFKGSHWALEFLVATPTEVAEFYTTKLSWREYWHQLREHHMWIQLFTAPSNSAHTRAERFTTAVALCFCYMFFTMLFYGIPEDHHHHISKAFHREVVFHSYYPIFSIGTKASLVGIVFGYILSISFRFIRRQLIPALIVWDTNTHRIFKRSVRLQAGALTFANEETTTEMPASTSVPFRIPSTDMLETEDWIDRITVEPEFILSNISDQKPYPDRYIHYYLNGLNSSRILKRRAKKSARNRRKGQPYSLSAAKLSFLTEALEEPVLEPVVVYHKKRRGGLLHVQTKFIPQRPFQGSDRKRVSFEPKALLSEPLGVGRAPELTGERIGDIPQPITSGKKLQDGGPKSTGGIAVETGSHLAWRLELCNIEHSLERHHCLPRWFVWIAWSLSLSLIAVFSSLLIFYGFRFSWAKSLNWMASFGWAILESFFIFQPIKVLIAYLILLYKRRIRHDCNPEKYDIKLRFKLLWVSGDVFPLVIWPLYYMIHPLRFNGEHELDPKTYQFPGIMTTQISPMSYTAAVHVAATEDHLEYCPLPDSNSPNVALPPGDTVRNEDWISSSRRRVSSLLKQPVRSVKSLKSYHPSTKLQNI